METSGSIVFQDVLLTHELDGSLSTSIFRKPTHTGRYLSFNSHYPFSQKLSIARTLYSRAEKIINNDSNRKSELSKIKDTLQSNGFPTPICSNTFFLKQYKTEIPRIITLLWFPFHMCKEFLSLLNVFWLKLALKWH